MEYVYIPRSGDKAVILEYRENFQTETTQMLVDRYNQEAKKGIVGVHRQGLFLIAMHFEFLERFDKSPLEIKDSIVISLNGPITYIAYDETFIYVE